MYTTRISFELMINEEVLLTTSRRLDHLWCTHDRSLGDWEEFKRCQMRANETYSETKRQFSVRNKDLLKNAKSLLSCGTHKHTLKSAVYGLISSLPPLVGGDGGLMCESVG